MCNHIPDGCCNFCLVAIESERDQLRDVLQRSYHDLEGAVKLRAEVPRMKAIERIRKNLFPFVRTVPGSIADQETDQIPV